VDRGTAAGGRQFWVPTSDPVNLVEGPAGSAFALHDRVSLAGVRRNDRGGDQCDGRALGGLAVEGLQADAGFVAVEDRVPEGVDAFVLVELAVDSAPLGRGG